jgi:hypothetical protein
MQTAMYKQLFDQALNQMFKLSLFEQKWSTLGILSGDKPLGTVISPLKKRYKFVLDF